MTRDITRLGGTGTGVLQPSDEAKVALVLSRLRFIDQDIQTLADTPVSLSQIQELLTLADLSDVSSTAPSTDQVLGWNGSAWVPVANGMRINSIQRGTIDIVSPATSNTASISAVNTSKSELRFLGQKGGGATNRANLVLTNSTTITADVGASPSSTVTVSYEITEWV